MANDGDLHAGDILEMLGIIEASKDAGAEMVQMDVSFLLELMRLAMDGLKFRRLHGSHNGETLN